jgi:hypothetical protein
MNPEVNHIPPGFRALTPYLIIRGAARAIEFYQQAFGARVLARRRAVWIKVNQNRPRNVYWLPGIVHR